MTRHIVFDTETTGLSPENGDRIVEIGCVELVNRKPTGRHLHLYLNPERESDEGALRVHGLTTEFLSDKPKFAEVADEFLAFTAGADIVIHNAPFDMGFLDKEFSLLGLPPLKTAVAGVTDSLALAKELFPGKRNSLDALCDRLGVDNSGRTLHGALLDAELLAEQYGVQLVLLPGINCQVYADAQRLEQVVSAARDDHVVALFGKAQRASLTDAARRAGDHTNLSLFHIFQCFHQKFIIHCIDCLK